MGTAAAEADKMKSKSRDPRWLRVDVCRDHLAGKCSRTPDECRFAHTTRNCTIENNKATVCYDSMRNRCNREFCKFYHPPKHIKECLLAFGKALEQERLEYERRIDSGVREGFSNGMIRCESNVSSESGSSYINTNNTIYDNEFPAMTRRYDEQSSIGQSVMEDQTFYPQKQQTNPFAGQQSAYLRPPYHQPNFQVSNNVYYGHNQGQLTTPFLTRHPQFAAVGVVPQTFPIYRAQISTVPLAAPLQIQGRPSGVYIPIQATQSFRYPQYIDQTYINDHNQRLYSQWTSVPISYSYGSDESLQ